MTACRLAAKTSNWVRKHGVKLHLFRNSEAAAQARARR